MSNSFSSQRDGTAVIRRSIPEDAPDFCRLILLSGPTLLPTFGRDAEKLMLDLFLQPKNMYGMDHTFFAVADGKAAGMALGYGGEAVLAEGRRTRELMILSLKFKFYLKYFTMKKVQQVFGSIGRNEFLLSNIAVYPEFRRMGFARRLMSEIEREARAQGNNKIVLDVEVSNQDAVAMYNKAGFIIEKTLPRFLLDNQRFEFFKMSKQIHP